MGQTPSVGTEGKVKPVPSSPLGASQHLYFQSPNLAPYPSTEISGAREGPSHICSSSGLDGEREGVSQSGVGLAQRPRCVCAALPTGGLFKDPGLCVFYFRAPPPQPLALLCFLSALFPRLGLPRGGMSCHLSHMFPLGTPVEGVICQPSWPWALALGRLQLPEVSGLQLSGLDAHLVTNWQANGFRSCSILTLRDQSRGDWRDVS